MVRENMNISKNLKVKIYLVARRLYRAVFRRLKDKVTPKEFLGRKERLVYCRPRIMEHPFVFKNVLNLKRGRMLDVGCAESFLITELATVGFEVHGIDVRLYPVKYPDVFFIEADMCKAPYKDNCFDVVVAVSTIEHIGITTNYWGVSVNEKAHRQAVEEMIRVLKP